MASDARKRKFTAQPDESGVSSLIWKNHVSDGVNYMTLPDLTEQKPRRQRFTSEAKRKTNAVRLDGACWRCRVLKKSCSEISSEDSTTSCINCIRKTKSDTWGNVPCIRDPLIAFRKDIAPLDCLWPQPSQGPHEDHSSNSITRVYGSSESPYEHLVRIHSNVTGDERIPCEDDSAFKHTSIHLPDDRHRSGDSIMYVITAIHHHIKEIYSVLPELFGPVETGWLAVLWDYLDKTEKICWEIGRNFYSTEREANSTEALRSCLYSTVMVLSILRTELSLIRERQQLTFQHTEEVGKSMRSENRYFYSEKLRHKHIDIALTKLQACLFKRKQKSSVHTTVLYTAMLLRAITCFYQVIVRLVVLKIGNYALVKVNGQQVDTTSKSFVATNRDILTKSGTFFIHLHELILASTRIRDTPEYTSSGPDHIMSFYKELIESPKTIQDLLNKEHDIDFQDRHHEVVPQVISSGIHDKVYELNSQNKDLVDVPEGDIVDDYEKDSDAVDTQGEYHNNSLHVELSDDDDIGSSIEASDEEDYDMLQVASNDRHNEILRVLPDDSVEAEDSQIKNLHNKLYVASLKGQDEQVKLLLKCGAEVAHIPGEYYGNALQAASHNGYREIVEMLLDKGAEVNVQHGFYKSALNAAIYGRHHKIVDVLLKRGADTSFRDHYNRSALEIAVERGYGMIVENLLNNGADGDTSKMFYRACYDGRERIVQILLDHYADIISSRGSTGTALQAAASQGHEKIVQMLLDNNADVDTREGYYGAPLRVAAFNGYEKIVQILLDKGADINARAGLDGTALQTAAVNGREKIVQILLDKGADINARAGFYGTALQTAAVSGHEKIVQMLLDKGADINARAGYYGTALQAAADRGHHKIVQMLLNRQAQLDRHANTGQ